MGSKIEWTEETWNPVTGCTKVSPGCKNCYAERMAKRLAGRYGYPADEPFRVQLHPGRLDEPFRWKRPRRAFVCSMGDLFHDDVPVDFIYEVLQRVYEAHQHVFQVLTKRPARMMEIMNRGRYLVNGITPMKNLWFGVTAEDQQRADERIPLLLQTPAAVRFVSVEPMLTPVDLAEYFSPDSCHTFPDGTTYPSLCQSPSCGTAIDWVIIGCESGPNRRPMDLDWARDLVVQCKAAGVSVFVKQLSIDGHVSHDPAEWPEDLRAREFPA